ncbi:MAG: class B sortase [Lachnospiraceae bacterium]|nr:class B sortase [Lachnospiraceae bacterium]
MSTKKKIFTVCALICLVGLILCVCWIVKYVNDTKKAETDLDEIKEEYVQEPVEEVEEPVPVEEPEPEPEIVEEEGYPGLDGFDVPDREIDFASLQEEQNQDIYAWIIVPGTKIDYPVLQHPEDPYYYLDYNIDGTKGYPGCIYTEFYNSKDWDDPNTVLYGHNMKNGTMFANLHYYEDPEFFKEHPYVYIYSPDVIRVYQIFAAYEFSDVHLLIGFDLESEESFEAYLNGIFDWKGLGNNFDTSVELDASDRIITLATCIGNKPTKRYLVQAVLVAEGELHETDS